MTRSTKSQFVLEFLLHRLFTVVSFDSHLKRKQLYVAVFFKVPAMQLNRRGKSSDGPLFGSVYCPPARPKSDSFVLRQYKLAFVYSTLE